MLSKLQTYLSSKNNVIKYFIFIEIILFLYTGIISSCFNRYNYIKYLPDIVFIVFFIYFLLNEKIYIKSFMDTPLIVFMSFLIFSFMSFFWSNYDVLATIKEYRFYFISFFIFYLYSNYLNKNIFFTFIKICYLSQLINFFLVLFQYFYMNLHPDFCNGIFGFTEYNNAVQGIFCSGMCIIAIIFYLNNIWDLKKSFGLLLLSCSICAFSEIKAFFVLLTGIFFLILIFEFFQKSNYKRLFRMILAIFIILIVGFFLLSLIMPENLKFMFNLKEYISYESFGAGDGAGRLNIFSYIVDNIFKKNIIHLFFGLGIGTLETEFVYTSGKIFVSLGVTGIVLLVLFFTSIIVKNIKNILFMSTEEMISTVFVIVILISILLWNCIFTSSCYFTFFLISLYKYNFRGELNEN